MECRSAVLSQSSVIRHYTYCYRTDVLTILAAVRDHSKATEQQNQTNKRTQKKETKHNRTQELDNSMPVPISEGRLWNSPRIAVINKLKINGKT